MKQSYWFIKNGQTLFCKVHGNLVITNKSFGVNKSFIILICNMFKIYITFIFWIHKNNTQKFTVLRVKKNWGNSFVGIPFIFKHLWPITDIKAFFFLLFIAKLNTLQWLLCNKALGYWGYQQSPRTLQCNGCNHVSGVWCICNDYTYTTHHLHDYIHRNWNLPRPAWQWTATLPSDTPNWMTLTISRIVLRAATP